MISNLLTSIEFEISLLLFVALLGYILASKINQSAVIGEILVGIIIGPSFFGLITYDDFVKSLAYLGAVILLFVVGLEFRLQDIFNIKYVIIALIGVIVPWIGGYALAKSFGYPFSSSIFIGTALTATSIAITANVLREMGKLNTDAAKAVIGAAVIDDILGLIVLSFSTQIVEGSLSVPYLLWIVLKSAIFLGIGAFIGNKYMSNLVEKLDKTRLARRYPEFVFIFSMAIAFLYSMVAELIGLSAIVGSFLAGVSLSNAMIIRSKDYRKGAEYLHIIFASIFFVSLGILVDFHKVSLSIIFFLFALTIVAILTKLIGCYIPSRLQGLSHTDSMIVGWGMSPRGEVAMIVALIGLSSSLINQEVYVSLVLMSLFTTIITPIVLRNWIYKKTG